MILDEKPHGLGTWRESWTKNGQCSDDCGLRSPVIQKKNRQKMVYLDTYIVVGLIRYFHY